MRIAYICADTGIPLLGDKGASVHLRSLAAALARREHEVTLACRRLDRGNPLPTGVAVEALPAEEEEQRAWFPDFFSRIRAQVVLERYSLSSGPALEAARSCGLRFVLEVNAPLVDEAARYRGLQQPDGFRAHERHLFTAADRIIAVSAQMRDHAIAAGATPDAVTVVGNGVDPEIFRNVSGEQVRIRYGLRESIVVGFVGSLRPWQGVRDLVTAFRRLPDSARLLIVGDGPDRGGIEAEARRQSLTGRVVLTGAVAHAEIPSHLAAMDIGVAPYVRQPDFYFSSVKVAEYLAAGLPVVATSQGDLPALVGAAGLLVAPGSVESLAEALGNLVADPPARRRMSSAATAQAAGLTWDRAAERVEAVLALQKVPV